MQKEIFFLFSARKVMTITLLIGFVMMSGIIGYLIVNKDNFTNQPVVNNTEDQAALGEDEYAPYICSKEGDLSVLANSAYPYNKARITSKEGGRGGSIYFPTDIFVINDSDFLLEGVNVPEVNRITVEWDGDNKVTQVKNFERGDTHWCFAISKEIGNLEKGVNIYMVRLYLDDDEVIEYSVQLTQNVFGGEINDHEILHINWLSEIEKKPVQNFFSKEELEGFYTDCNYYEDDYKTKRACYELFSFYKAGTVSGGTYSGYDYYLLSQTFIGHGEVDYYYRLIFNPSDRRLILLSKYSNEPDEKDKEFFTLAENITVDNLLPPPEISIPNTSYFLEPHSESPNVLFADMISYDYYNSRKVFTGSGAGDVYIEEKTKTFFVRVPDGSLMIYRIKLPFVKDRGESEGWRDDLLLDIKFTDGKQNVEHYSHGSTYQFTCLGGYLYDIALPESTNFDSQLTLAGVSASGDKFYELRDERKLREIYEKKGAIAYEGFPSRLSYTFKDDISFEDFLALHPLLFWKDPFGRWVQFTNNIFSPVAECGGGMSKSAL